MNFPRHWQIAIRDAAQQQIRREQQQRAVDLRIKREKKWPNNRNKSYSCAARINTQLVNMFYLFI